MCPPTRHPPPPIETHPNPFALPPLFPPHRLLQTAAWGWQHAATLSHTVPTLPMRLFSALWHASEDALGTLCSSPDDALAVFEAWRALMQRSPRHFSLRAGALDTMAALALPVAAKRMGAHQLARLAALSRDVATHGGEVEGASPRDLMRPVFALVAAETAWRAVCPQQYVSPNVVSAVIDASTAWTWKPAPGCVFQGCGQGVLCVCVRLCVCACVCI
jgi:hypothetical protein